MNNDNELMNLGKPKNQEKFGYFVLLLVFILSFLSGYYSNQLSARLWDGKGRQLVSLNNGIAGTTTSEIVIDKNGVPPSDKKKVSFDIFWETWDYVKNNYVESNVDESKLFYGSLEGMVGSLQDPYSVYFEPETSREFQQEISGSFDGIGAEIGLKNGAITVISPLTGSPAEKAGLKPGDMVISIDDKETKDMSLNEAVNLIRGKRGTRVTLVIYRKAEKDTRTIEVARDVINIKSVEWAMLPGDIVDLKLKYFNEDTLSDFRKAVNAFLPEKPKGIILDIRNNPGGFLSTAIEITSYWVGGDDIIVIERGRDQNYIGEKANNSNALLKKIPTIVLINKGSASGSEILAGALQDWKLAKIVGETSFGKGSVQDLKQFSDGSSLKLTIAKWYTPKGREINEKGIVPDERVELTDEDWDNSKDPQMDKAIELLTVK